MVKNLLKAPYPFFHEYYKTIYEQEKNGLCGQVNFYKCNFCKIKLLGDKQLWEHNKCFRHQKAMEMQIDEVLAKSTFNRYECSI